MNALQNLSCTIPRSVVFDMLKALFITRAFYLKTSANTDYSRGFDDGFKAALAAVAQSIGANY